MKVVNLHQRLLAATPAQAGALVDALGTPQDPIWPAPRWPRLRLDRPLQVGARGRHGPIRYEVQAYQPGALVQLRFTAPGGLDGWHAFEVLDATRCHCVLEHRIEMRLRGWARLTWPLVYAPLHDALIQDLLSNAQQAVGHAPRAVRWSPYVRLLRRALG